jgi:hypothetical protein
MDVWMSKFTGTDHHDGEAGRTERWRPRRLDWQRLAASAATSATFAW